MARTEHVVVNKLHEEAQAKGRSDAFGITFGLKALGAHFAIVYIIFGVLFNVPIAWIISIYVPSLLFMLLHFFVEPAPDQVLAAGAEGEDHIMSVLERLSDKYTLFNQLNIPNPRSSTGVNEADVVVHGPSSIFVIEVKHNNGQITVNEQAPKWVVQKVGRNGGEYEKEMRNPIAQIKNLVWLLSEHLKKTNAKPWVQGIVVFSNSDAELYIEGPLGVPVLRSHQLLEYIESFNGNSPPGVLARAGAELVRLRQVQTPLRVA